MTSYLLRAAAHSSVVAAVATAMLTAAWVGRAEARGGVPWTSLLLQPGPAAADVWLAPAVYNHSLLGPIGGPAGDALWYAVQWSNPFPITNTTPALDAGACVGSGVPGAVAWNVDNEQSLRLCMFTPSSGAGYAIELAQNGTATPCGQEYDAFVSPTDGDYANAAPNILPTAAATPLAAMSALQLSFSATLTGVTVRDRCGRSPQCGPSPTVDYGYAVAALVMSNAAAGQTLFYQVILADTRAGQCAGLDPCLPYSNWFFTAAPQFGVSESIGAFEGGQCLNASTPAAQYNLQLAQPLTAALAYAAQTYGADGNASAWHVTGAYVGTGSQGSVTSVFQVWDVALAYQPADAGNGATACGAVHLPRGV
jgi:hypothetical protein